MLKTSEAFEKAFTGLNPAQRQAVQQTEGPVLVLAGPGTGKTQILAVRVGQILKTTDTQPRDILCLTFTNTGVMAMRKRLASLLGAAVAQQVNVNTFHGFCAQILREKDRDLYEQVLDVTAEEEAASELQRYRILRNILSALPHNHPLSSFRGDIFYHVPRMIGLFQHMKREALTPDDIQIAVDQHIKGIYADEKWQYKRPPAGKKAGDLKPDAYDEINRFEQTAAAAQLLPLYNEALRTNKFYDFDDMIGLVQKEFDDPNSELLFTIRERFLYYLVDEYQDTNGAQNKLLYTLLGDDEQPNVFVVGDDDQSIYRFQGANVSNISDYLERYPTCYVVPLVENYRSSRPILAHAEALITQSQTRLIQLDLFKERYPDVQKTIIAKGRNADLSAPPEYRAFPDAESEAVFIADDIAKRVAGGEAKFNDIAVLYQKHKNVDTLLDAFRQRNIPYVLHYSDDLLAQELAQKLILLLQCLYQYQQREQYQSVKYLRERIRLPHAVLHLPFWNIDWACLHTALVDYRTHTDQLRDTELYTRHIFEFLAKWRPQPDLDLNPNTVNELASQLMYWSGRLGTESPAQALEHIVQKGFILKYILTQPDASRQLLVLRAFYELLETEAPDIESLGKLLQDIDEQQEYGLRLPVKLSIGTAEGVQCLTAHSSKGEEYPLVYVIHCSEHYWGPNKANKSREFKLPDLLLSSDSGNEAELEEKRRLFFVAMTRAQKRLTISYLDKSDNGRNKAKLYIAGFLNELLTKLEIKPITLEPSAETTQALNDFLAFSFEGESKNQDLLMTREMIAKVLTDFKLSATHLNDYLHCPRSYYFSRVAKIPGTTQPAMVFGTAIHHALNMLFINQKQTKMLATVDDMVRVFEAKIESLGRSITPQQYERLLRLGQSLLPNLYEHRASVWQTNPATHTEYSIDAQYDGIPITGKMDRMDLLPNGWRIIDYKTGKDSTEVTTKVKLNGPSDKKPDGGEYWRQMVFYHILTQAAAPEGEPRVAETVFEFVQPDNGKDFQTAIVQVSDEDQKMVLRQMHTAYQGIMRQEFSKLTEEQRDGEKRCDFCPYYGICWGENFVSSS